MFIILRRQPRREAKNSIAALAPDERKAAGIPAGQIKSEEAPPPNSDIVSLVNFAAFRLGTVGKSVSGLSQRDHSKQLLFS
jgi:hypothetical protein